MICERCGRKTEGPHFIFSQVDQRDKRYTFGFFCYDCTIELSDQLKGKLEWFHMEESWKGYIRPEARPELERAGFIHSKHDSRIIEIAQVGRKQDKDDRSDARAILRVKYAGGLISKEEYKKLLKLLRNPSS